MLLGSPRRLALAFLACSLLACGDEKPRVDDGDDSEPRSDDNGSEETAEQHDAGERARDEGQRPPDAGGRASDAAARIDASRADADLPAPRDAASVREVPDAATTTADASVTAGDAGDAGKDPGPTTPGLTPAFHIPLRVHRADSGLRGQDIAAALEEMNEIWWKQAGVCFEIEVVKNEMLRPDGFDLWFHRTKLGCNTSANGVYCGDHDVHLLDAPSLGPADSPAWNTRLKPARTSAHELGHGLTLEHYNGFADSNDSLMSSGRQGFKLHESEITAARARAKSKALPDSPSMPCAPVPVVD